MLKIRITVNGNDFEFEGEAVFTAIFEAFKLWLDKLLPSGTPADHSELITRLDALKAQQENILGDITLAREALAQLNSITNDLSAAVQTVVVADQAEDDAFRAEIEDLKRQIAEGKAITSADLDELASGMGGTKATLVAVADALKAMGASPSNPIPPVTIPPVEVPPQ